MMRAPALAFVLLAAASLLAGCHSTPPLVEESGSRTHELVLAPDPGVSDRAPLEGLGAARTLLCDVATDRKSRALLDHMTGDHFLELEILDPAAPVSTATLTRAPTPPSPAALRILPEQLSLTPQPDGTTVLHLDYFFGEGCLVDEQALDERGGVTGERLSSDRVVPFELALDEFVQRRAKGWTLVKSMFQPRASGGDFTPRALSGHDRSDWIDAEVARGHRLWPK